MTAGRVEPDKLADLGRPVVRVGADRKSVV